MDDSPAPFALDDEHREFQQVCRSLVDSKVMPLVPEAERAGTFPTELWPLLAGAGLLGLRHDPDYGGTGGDTLAISLFAEELARSSGGVAITPLVSSYMASPHLTHFGTDAQKEQYLRGVAEGRLVGAIAVTEPGTGSDVASIRTRATRAAGGWVIDGAKMFITNGGIADFVIVAAKTEPDAGHQGITMFIVEQGQEGFSASTPLPKMGWHASDTRELTFDGCFVPDDRVLGGMNRGFYQIMTCFETERILLAAMGVGLAQAALDDARAYAVEREAFGSPIATYQAVRHKLSDMAVDVEAARLVTYWAAARLEAGDPEAPSASAMAKLQAAATANRVADDAVQIFGGYGFIDETRVAMHYRDARILRIGGGTDEILREIVARRMGL